MVNKLVDMPDVAQNHTLCTVEYISLQGDRAPAHSIHSHGDTPQAPYTHVSLDISKPASEEQDYQPLIFQKQVSKVKPTRSISSSRKSSSTTSTASSSDFNTGRHVSAQEVKKYSQPIRVKEVYMSAILPPLINKPTASDVTKFSSLKRLASYF